MTVPPPAVGEECEKNVRLPWAKRCTACERKKALVELQEITARAVYLTSYLSRTEEKR